MYRNANKTGVTDIIRKIKRLNGEKALPVGFLPEDRENAGWTARRMKETRTGKQGQGKREEADKQEDEGMT